MKAQISVIIFLFMILLNTSIFAQVNPGDLKFVLNKQSASIEPIQISSSAVLSQLKVNQIKLDVFSPNGEYAGSIELSDWKVPMDEFAPGEKLKIAWISMTDTKSGAKLELKDLPLN